MSNQSPDRGRNEVKATAYDRFLIGLVDILYDAPMAMTAAVCGAIISALADSPSEVIVMALTMIVCFWIRSRDREKSK